MSEADDRAQLAWEARMGPRAAAAAFAAALLPLLGSIVAVAGLTDAGEGTAGFLLAIDDAPAAAIAGALLRALGVALLPLALAYLYRATLARRPEAPTFPLPLLFAAALGLAAVLLAQEILRLDVAQDFVAGGDQSEEQADELIEGSAVQPFVFAQLALRVAFGGSIVVIALNAMRAGLLSRFIGVIGIGVGAFYAVPLVEPTLILLFWGVALGFLFIDRWPGVGRGPAWRAVEATPWPSTAERVAAERARAAEAEGEGTPSSEEAPAPRPSSRKRRRSR